MKRSQIIDIISDYFIDYSYDIEFGDANAELRAEELLNQLEDLGMKPPLTNCKMVEDTYNGGTKHGPVEHKWDEE